MHAYSALILKADRLYADLLRRHVLSVHPNAQCTLVRQIAQAESVLNRSKLDLFVTGMEVEDGDTLDLIARVSLVGLNGQRTLVIARRIETRLVEVLQRAQVFGIFDASTEEPESLTRALNQIAGGRSYWSDSFQPVISKTTLAQKRIKLLTPTEQLIFALAGDGSDDATVGAKLGMKTSSVQAVRKKLHAKLRITRQGALVCAAAQYGFVRFTNTGPVPIGLGILLTNYQTTSKRPVLLTARLAAEYPDAAEAAARRFRTMCVRKAA
jgi:DNA-binding NarL/FixJ family response regulator